jgi:hypothetical protein
LRKTGVTEAGDVEGMTMKAVPRRRPIRFSLADAAALLLLAASASPASADPQRTANLVVYGDDPCPTSSADEIVVCARRPENERYRIPKALRDKARGEGPASRSWASHWQGVEDATRYTRPDSCSPVGSWGQTGCLQAMLRRWWEERHEASSDAP